MEKIPNKTCSKCGAHWIEGQLYWSTGAKGTDQDLAGLVCNNLRDDDPTANECINTARGQDGGMTWEYRRGYVDGLMSEAMRPKQDGGMSL